MTKIIENIPTNIIFGFLGSGKTTAILSLLARKPEHETWAVLVNEFGERGIDGKIIAQTGVAVKEIPGGCLCCATGLPFQVGLNNLVRLTRPDRLLIEPTGLGHPQEIINKLLNNPAHSYVSLKSVITLVDPRNLSDNRYLNHEHYIEQIQVADVLLANKIDLCSEKELQQFESYVDTLSHSKRCIDLCQQGEIPFKWIDFNHVPKAKADQSAYIQKTSARSDIPENPNTFSWSFSSSEQFSYSRFSLWCRSFQSMRLKAFVKTDQGDFLFNQTGSESTETPSVNEIADSTIEVIGVDISHETLDKMLTQCLSSSFK